MAKRHYSTHVGGSTPEPRATVEMWPVPIADGWDVRMEPHTGLIACGNERLSVVDPVAHTVRTVATSPHRLLRWLNAGRVIWQHSTGPDTAELWSAPVADLAAVMISPVAQETACGNTFTATNNQWAAWLSNGLRLAAGEWTHGAPILTNVYESQMAGEWLVTSRDDHGMVVIWMKRNGGGNWVVVSESASLPAYPQYWANPSGIVGVGYYGLAGIITPGDTHATAVTCAPGRPEGIPRLIDVGTTRYVITASYSVDDQPVLYIRTFEVAMDPARRTQEISRVFLPFGFIQFEGREGPDGRLQVAGNDSKGQLAWLSIDVAALPVGPITPSPPIPPEPEPPTPPTDAPPKVTITSYAPTTGEAPLDCQAVWAAQPTSGPVETVAWQYTENPDGVWSTSAIDPASDPDHTYHFALPGTQYLRLKATGPGGTATTGAMRKVTVVAAPEPPKPEPPMPDMLQTSAFRLASGHLLCADQHDNNVVNATREGEPAAWESFLVEPHPVGGAWVALKTDTGYVCAQSTGHQMMASGPPSAALALRIIELDNSGDVALMASDGFYLWAENGGGGVVLRNGSRIDDFSTFAHVPGVEKEAAPPEPVPVPGGKPSLEVASRGNGAFLGVPGGFEWAFMYPGWSREKRREYRSRLKAKGLTHIPFAPWGAYGNNTPFDFRRNPQGFRDLINETQSDGCVVMLFAITDVLPGEPGYTEDDAHNYIKGWLSQFKDIVAFFVTGWEFSQINGSFGSKTANGPTTGNLPTHATTAFAPMFAGQLLAGPTPREYGIETPEEVAHHIKMRQIRKLRESPEVQATLEPEVDPRGYTPLPPHSNRLYFAWSGDAHLRIARTLRETFGSEAIVYCHFPPERITGWPDFGHTSSDPRGEPDWWKSGDSGRAMNGICYQRPPNEPENYTIAHTIGGTDEDGGRDIGDATRITKMWGIDRAMIAFEFSRDMPRSARLKGPFSNAMLSGNTNQPA